MFELKPLERESSSIAESAHDPVHNVMRLKFKGKSGSIYDYQNVSAEVHQRVRDEGGSYFDAEIKKNPKHYPYSKVS